MENPLELLLVKFPEIEIMYSTSLYQLVREGGNGRVTGVIATNSEGDYLGIDAAKGVILCTGGYCGDQEMLEELNPEVASSITQNVGTPNNTGDGIKAAVWAGAAKDATPNAMIFDRGAVLPGETGGAPYSMLAWGPGFVFGSQPFLIVNTRGERFVNESIPYDYKAHAAWNQPGKVWIELWDSSWREDVERFHTIGCSRIVDAGNGAANGIFNAEGHQAYIESMLEEGACVEADSIEELAEAMGLPAETLAKNSRAL